jgi:hypothetical protein
MVNRDVDRKGKGNSRAIMTDSIKYAKPSIKGIKVGAGRSFLGAAGQYRRQSRDCDQKERV